MTHLTMRVITVWMRLSLKADTKARKLRNLRLSRCSMLCS